MAERMRTEPVRIQHKSGANYKYVALVIVLLIVIAYLLMRNQPAQTSLPSVIDPAAEAAVKSVKDVYGLLTENNVDVISAKEENGLYKVTVKTTLQNGQSNVADIFATKDGSMIAGSMIIVSNYTQLLTKEKAFAECLAAKNVRVIGQTTDTNTVAQLRELGNFAYKIYFDCSGNNLAVCQQLNITQIPLIIAPNATLLGPQPISYFEKAAGCVF